MCGRFDLARPDVSASSCIESGWVRAASAVLDLRNPRNALVVVADREFPDYFTALLLHYVLSH